MKTKVAIKNKAKIHEIFVSRQGEGLYAGEKQIFLRFSHCNLACVYCDTRNEVGQDPQKGDVAEHIERLFWQESPIHSVSFTGGEPLLYPQWIKEIGRIVQTLNVPLFLETNATLTQAFLAVQDLIDIVSMDIKIPSVGLTPMLWKEHEAFLAATKGKIRYCKIVISEMCDLMEFEKALNLIAKEDPRIPTFLQPVSGQREMSLEKQGALRTLAENSLWDVRLQPQWHKIWGLR